MKAEIKGRDAFRRFATAGRAIFTIRSRETGTRFTYRVRVATGTPDHYFVDFLGGSDNTSDYRWLGMLKPRGQNRQLLFFHGGPGAKAGRDALVTIAFGWAWSHPDSGKLEVWHEGRCGRCSRRLTVPESIESGLGPECAGKVAA